MPIKPEKPTWMNGAASQALSEDRHDRMMFPEEYKDKEKVEEIVVEKKESKDFANAEERAANFEKLKKEFGF